METKSFWDNCIHRFSFNYCNILGPNINDIWLINNINFYLILSVKVAKCAESILIKNSKESPFLIFRIFALKSRLHHLIELFPDYHTYIAFDLICKKEKGTFWIWSNFLDSNQALIKDNYGWWETALFAQLFKINLADISNCPHIFFLWTVTRTYFSIW